MAPSSKRAARERAHFVLIDESGLLLAPLVRRSLGPAGQTPDGGRGGVGTFDNGGGGGGGRILIEALPGRLEVFGSISADGGSGGSSFFGTGRDGIDGVITIRTIPEPTALLLATAGAIYALGLRSPKRCRICVSH